MAERFEEQWALPRIVRFVTEATGRSPRDVDLELDLEGEVVRRAADCGGNAGLVCGELGATLLLFGHHFDGSPSDQRAAASQLVVDLTRLMSDGGIVVTDILTPANDKAAARLPPLDGTSLHSSPPLTMNDWLVWLFLDDEPSVSAQEVLGRISECGVAFESAVVLGFEPPNSVPVRWEAPPREAITKYGKRVLEGRSRYRIGTPSLTVVGDQAWSVAKDNNTVLVVLPSTVPAAQIEPLLSVSPERTVYAVAESPQMRSKAPDKRVRLQKASWTASYFRGLNLLKAPGSYVPTWGERGDRSRSLAYGARHLVGPGHLEALNRRRRNRLTQVADDRWLLTD